MRPWPEHGSGHGRGHGSGHGRGHGSGHGRGFALIAVMVALAILLTLVTPFLVGILAEADSSSRVVAQAQVEHQNLGERDLLLHLASQTALGEDTTTPFWDSLSEFPSRLDLPAAFKAKGPRRYSSLSSGQVWDLQGRININTASPLLIANLLGLSASLREEVAPDGETLAVDEARSFPEENGVLLVDGERIPYERRDGNVFTGLQRTALDHTLREDVLVLDYRCVALVTCMYDPTGNGQRDRLTPYSHIEQVNRITGCGVPPFTEAEMDLLRKHCTTDSGNELASRWGKPQRVFTTLDPQIPLAPVIYVKSALGFGAGTLVRIRSLEGDTVEHALVAKTIVARGRAGDINLQNPWQLVLLRPVRHDFTSMQTVIEPLVPHPVNINTADPAVLVATLRNLRDAPRRPPATGDRRSGRARSRSRYGPKIGREYAREIVNRMMQLRGGAGPFQGWEDLCKRLLTPLGLEAGSFPDKKLVLLILQNWLTGRTPIAEMVTAPISFTSASLVEYRVATMRNKASLQESARRERQGIAWVIPSHPLAFPILTQDTWEECFRLSRRAPGYITYPINVAPLHPRYLANDPADHVAAYLWASLWPDSGLGEPRYPNRGFADVGVRQVPAIVRPAYGELAQNESFRLSRHPEGRDVTRDGHYEMLNVGPAGPGSGPQKRRRRKDQKAFPFTGQQGMPRRYAIHFWAHPRTLGPQALFEAAGDLRDRNVISLRIEEGNFVLEVLDESGLDPDPQATRTQPERTAGQIRIPIAELGLRDNIPVHFNFGVDGNRPGQLSMMVDGVPRRGTRFRTWLTREIPEYPRPESAPAYDPRDKGRYLEIHVEDSEHFPEQGVVRIGRELFEYTGRSGGVLYCKDLDSMGGRKARLRWYELRDELDKDLVDPTTGRIRVNESDISRAAQERAPAHPEGAAVELYGYSAPIYRNTVITTGTGSLTERIGTFAVARGFLRNPEEVAIPSSQGPPVRLGRGLMEANRDDIELANPLPDQAGKGYPPDKAEDRIFDAFPESGGFALLVQRPMTFSSTEMQAPGSIDVGGVEVIRYARRKAHILTGIQRAVQLPNLKAGADDPIFDGRAHVFVTDWDPRIVAGRGGDARPVRELAGWVLYVVPVSLPVNGSLTDPTVLGWTEWAQIYQRGDERKTEWVRYDVIVEGRHLVRAQPRAYTSLCLRITGSTNRGRADVNRGGGSVPDIAAEYDPPDPTLIDMPRIGYVERVENEYPVIYQARRALQFRGDPTTNTSPHEHAAGTMVLPTHRLELDAGLYGGLSARAGRNDRVTFVGGTQAHGNNRPPADWHTVNWTFQRHGFDVRPDGANSGNSSNSSSNNSNRERLGPYPFQVIGLKDGVTQAFIGAPERNDFRDVRQVDRVVKFPSGELPAAYIDHARFGGSNGNEYPAMQGIVDELVALWRQSEPLVLLEDLAREGGQFTVHQHLRVFPWGTITVPQDLTQLTPDYGGLVMIDGEILAYKAHAGGVFQVAENGRGLLGTKARAHGRGARVHFLRHLPAAILATGVSENNHQLVVNHLGNLPRAGGTLLMGRELLHYTWTVLNRMMEMPVWREPASQDQRQGERTEKGLFRGRYGTVPQSAAAGEAVIWFPHRYWDRFRERADDPETAYAQVTLDQDGVYYRDISWKEENPDEQLLDLRCYVRVDGLASFDADPERERMLFLFKDGEPGGNANPLGRQGSVLEARFVTEYRPGAFDPENFLMHAWKLTPTLRDCWIRYEGETHIVRERVVQR